MLKWIKKNPLVHSLILVLTLIPLFIILWIILVLSYGIIQTFDPNYIEFGPTITLYKSKNCTEPENSQSSSCIIYADSPSIYKNNPPTLYQEIKKVADIKIGISFEGINFNSVNVSQWECSADGIIINNLQEKVQYKKKLYMLA